jgi:RHS repeat-associated protein
MFTNQGGTAIEDMLFYPWGDVWQSWGSGGYNFAKLRYNDVTTNTNLTTTRVNSPNFGRWFTPDPAGQAAVRLDDPQTWNMYAYVRNNPTTLTDPSGLDTPDPLNGSEEPQIESTYSEPNVAVDDTGGHRPAGGEKEPESNNQQAQNTEVAQNGTTDKLVNAQNAAMSNATYQPGATTHCSQATCGVAKATGAPMGPLTDAQGNPLRADQIRANLANPHSGYRPVSAAEAQQLANQGKLVIVAGPGHVSTVRPDNVPGENVPGKGPVVANVGTNNGVMRLNYVFTKSALPEVRFYTPNQ